MLPKKNYLTTEDTENTEEIQWARAHSRCEWGRAKTLQASLLDFCFFSANPSWLGSSVPIRDIRGYFLSNRTTARQRLLKLTT